VLGEDVSKLVDFDWDVVIRNQQAWTGRFNREIAG
jgi:putative spermidine/putrescine transport system substrate-binding protein